MTDSHALVFLDVAPSEGHVQDNDTLSIAAVACGQSCIFAPKTDYKHTRGRRKIKTARRFSEAIATAPDVHLFAVTGHARGQAVTQSGIRILNALGLNVSGDRISFGQHSLAADRAAVFAWYAWSLAMFSVPLSRIGKWQKSTRISFALDPLPGDAPNGKSPGLAFLKYATDNLLWPFWQQCSRDTGVTPGFAYLSRRDGRSPKRDAPFVVTDWIAASCHAAVGGRPFADDPALRRAVAAPLFALLERERAYILRRELLCRPQDLTPPSPVPRGAAILKQP